MPSIVQLRWIISEISERMLSIGWARTRAVCFGFCLMAVALYACGGGGSGGGDGGTPPGQVGTPIPGGTPTPTEAPVIVVQAGESIAAAVQDAPAESFVIVAPGTYNAVVLDNVAEDIFLFADETGEFTDSAPAPVTIVGRSTDDGALQIFNQSGLSIEGFTIRGGSFAGIWVFNSVAISISNCTVTRSGSDALLFQSSDTALVFNSVFWDNDGAGIALLGTPNVSIINNTLYDNRDGGIFLGTDDEFQPSVNTFLRNNILSQNPPVGILVDTVEPSSLDGYDGDFNLNTDDYDGPSPGANDILGPDGSPKDPLFIFPNGGDFRLAAPSSPAIDAGDDSIGDDLVGTLLERSTQIDNSTDVLPVDLGYHYALPLPTPTRRPNPTRTPVPTSSVATPTQGTVEATPTSNANTPEPTATSAVPPTRTRAPTFTRAPTRTQTPTRTPR